MVRLIDAMPQITRCANRFQFQNGAINRIIWHCIEWDTLCFNSKMVRLIGGKPKGETFVLMGFNSKMVRLIGKSIMDRLVKKQKFQFQNGAINSKPNLIFSDSALIVSIPKWCD